MNDSASLPFGRVLRDLWVLDPEKLTVNHGSYGAAPLAILEEQDRWRRRMEAQPTFFMQKILPDALRSSAQTLAAFVGAKGQDLVFVDNATTAANAVLNSLVFAPDDEILLLSHTYGAVRKTALHVASRTGAKIVDAQISFPDPDDAVIIANIAAAITPRTRLAIIDHITSPSALILPVAEIIAACHARGVPVLVDGAHAPGHLPIDLTALGADWYTGNCHKWLMSPKGAAFLWASPARQDGLHPTVISHGYGQGFLAEFDWTGTRDFSAALSVPAAIAFHQRLGGHSMMARNKQLAWSAAEHLAKEFGTGQGAAAHQHGAMTLVRLPASGEVSLERIRAMRSQLLDQGCDAQLTLLADAMWVRLSVAAYNESEDFDRLVDYLARVM